MTTENLLYTKPSVAASKFGVFGSSVANATTYYQTQLIRPGQALTWYTNGSNWLPDQLEQFGNYVYGRPARKADELENTEDGDGWKFRGHGLVQTTGRGNTQRFANYVDAHPIAGQPTGAQIMADPETNISQNKYVAARSAALYWSQRVTNARADALDDSNTAPPNFYYTGPNDTQHYDTATPQHSKLNYVPGNLFTDNITKKVGGDTASFLSRWNYWRRNVGLAYLGHNSTVALGNPYESMRDVLNRVGVKAVNATNYQNQIGFSLRAPKALEIASTNSNLLASLNTDGSETTNPTNSIGDPRLQSLLTEAKTSLDLNDGEYDMFTIDQPTVPPNTPPVIIAAKAKPGVQRERVLGVCELVELYGAGKADLFPVSRANNYFHTDGKPYPKSYKPEITEGLAKISVLQQPKHGHVAPSTPESKLFDWRYVPTKGYEGTDSAILQVEGNGHKIKLKYFFMVTSGAGESALDNKDCKGLTWKISSLTTDPISLASLQRSNDLATVIANASESLTNFTNLPGTAVGENTGTGNTATITLDTNAAGHNWFIDSTPADNNEYLPTSDANVWIAKAGSAAEGKMDMLSVLLHEYGHALGFEHSADTSDFMSASLVAGERRLPTADELTLMSQLIAKLKVGSGSDGTDSNTPSSPSSPSSPFDPAAPLGGSLGLLALGRLRRNDYGGWRIALDSTQTIAPQASTQYQAQYEAAINATLTNGSFNGDSNNVNSANTNIPANWRSSGNIALNTSTGAVGVANAGTGNGAGNIFG